MFAHLIGMLRESAKGFVKRRGQPLMQGLGVICDRLHRNAAPPLPAAR